MSCYSSSDKNIKSPQAKDRATPHLPQPYSQHDGSQFSQIPPQILKPSQTPNNPLRTIQMECHQNPKVHQRVLAESSAKSKKGRVIQRGDKIRNDTPSGTEENKVAKQEKKLEQSMRIHSARAREQSYKKAKPHLPLLAYDLCPKQNRICNIFCPSSNFLVQKPYSTHSDWQKTLLKSIKGKLVPKILGFCTRHWIQERIKLQINITIQNVGSFCSLISQCHFIQLRKHFKWMTWAVVHFYFLQKHENKHRFPKANSKKWLDCFEYKGVYIRVLPYEEAYFVQNELQTLKYVQQEILELNSLFSSLTQQCNQLGQERNLAKNVILPPPSVVSWGSFYLFGSLVIYMLERQQLKKSPIVFTASAPLNDPGKGGVFLRVNLNARRVLEVSNSVVQQANYNFAQLWPNQSQVSFSYLLNNIDNDLLQNSLFKFMQVLKWVSSRNMIPIVDFEKFNRDLDEQNLELKCIIVSLFVMLSKLGEYNTALVKFPCNMNEELQLLQMSIERTMDLKEVRDLMNIEDEESKGEDSFIKRQFQKHGWELFLVQNGMDAVNENFRITNFFNQKEILIRQKGSPLLYSNVPNQSHLHDELGSRAQEWDLEEESQLYISRKKQTNLSREYSVSDIKIFSNALVSGYNYKCDFKSKFNLPGVLADDEPEQSWWEGEKYILNGHSYSTRLENLFSAGAEQVVRVIEQSDNIFAPESSSQWVDSRELLKELIHQKGLNLLVKIRLVQVRELVIMDILGQIMHRIINEEIKIKTKVSQQQMMEKGQAMEREYYQISQPDLQKDILIFPLAPHFMPYQTDSLWCLEKEAYMNAILMWKLAKLKQSLDETLTGLSLSLLVILGLPFQMSLSKEELIYLESWDVLEDISETPSKAPVLLVNQMQAYFSDEFGLDFIRICLQDKLLLLSRTQPITSNELKHLGHHIHLYTIKEQACFLLERSLMHHAKERSLIKRKAKVMTQSDKEIFKQSIQKLKLEQDNSLISQPSQRNEGLRRTPIMDLGPLRLGRGLGKNDSLIVQNYQDSKADRISKATASLRTNSTPSTRSKIFDWELVGSEKQIEEFTSPLLYASKLAKLSKQVNSNPLLLCPLTAISAAQDTWLHLDHMIWGRRTSRCQTFRNCRSGPTSSRSMCRRQLCPKMKTHITGDLHYFFDEQSNTQIGNNLTVLKSSTSAALVSEMGEISRSMSHHEMLSLNILNELAIVMESFSTNVYSVGASEQVLLEAFIYQAILTHFFEQDLENLFKILSKIRDQLFVSFQSSTECIIVNQILTSIFFQDHKEAQPLIHSRIYSGNKLSQQRGKGWSDQVGEELPDRHDLHPQAFRRLLRQRQPRYPLQLVNRRCFARVFFAWQLSLLAMNDDQKMRDSEFGEELFDVYLKSLRNYIKFYKEQQLQNYHNPPRPTSSGLYLKNLLPDRVRECTPNFNSATMKKNPGKLVAQKQEFRYFIWGLPGKEVFFPWMLKFSPLMYQSGVIWSNQQIKNLFFHQIQMMVSSSSSIILLSNHNFSHQSFPSSNSTIAKEKRNMHLGTYSLIFGKEQGGISKSDMNGVLFTWCSYNSGQIAVKIVSSNDQQRAHLKVLYPKMIPQLRDEIINKICCRHNRTLVINIHEIVFGWELNEQRQLGGDYQALPVIKNDHSIGLTKNGELYSWGGGYLTGTGDQTSITNSTQLKLSKIQNAVCGGLHTVAMTKDGEILSLGSTECGQLGLPQLSIMTLTQDQGIPVLTPRPHSSEDPQAHRTFPSTDGSLRMQLLYESPFQYEYSWLRKEALEEGTVHYAGGLWGGAQDSDEQGQQDLRVGDEQLQAAGVGLFQRLLRAWDWHGKEQGL